MLWQLSARRHRLCDVSLLFHSLIYSQPVMSEAIWSHQCADVSSSCNRSNAVAIGVPGARRCHAVEQGYAVAVHQAA